MTIFFSSTLLFASNVMRPCGDGLRIAGDFGVDNALVHLNSEGRKRRLREPKSR